MKVKKGDTVIIISGKDKGKEGKITRSLPREDRVIVEGVNIRKRHQKARRRGEKGQLIEFSAPLHVSNVMHKDAKKKTARSKEVVTQKAKNSAMKKS